MALAAMPLLYGYFAKPAGATYLGEPFATDDTMVYAAWMRQAMDGRLLFDNRFAVDPQPGLTLHIYFLALGWLAKLIGIPLAQAAARVGFAGLFVLLAHRLIGKVVEDPYTQKLTLAVTTFGGGLGFLVWHTFGVAIVKPSPIAPLLLGRLPTDVWQTEAFVFPSMLVNGLFMVSLCLIVGIFLSVLDARESWKPVPIGALCFLLLMNIHSYDVLLVALVLVAFLGASAFAKRATLTWGLRTVTMGLGAIPPALWFLHVLKNDPVFQARAATETYAPNFRLIVFGLILLIALSSLALLGKGAQLRRKVGVGVAGLVLVVAFAVAEGHKEGYWLGPAAWIVAFAIACALSACLSDDSDGKNLVVAWAFVGLVAPYFPALFQRKLAMGISAPWAILAGIGFAAILASRERGVRNLVAIFGLALLSGTSVQWFFRETSLIRGNVSNTTVHPVHVSENVGAILARLAQDPSERRVVVAMPGIASPAAEPDRFNSPYLPDLNPIASGFSGAYSYAGHWSETPDYGKRRNEATAFFLRANDDERRAFLQERGIGYIIAPVPEAFPEISQMNDGVPLADVRALGKVLVDGSQFRLIEVTRP